MDGLRWSRVLLQWVKDSHLIPCECDSIEQCSVEEFYRQFRSRIQQTVSLPEEDIISFLKVHFPHYELYLTETGQIAAPDHFYIFSLLLFFSCVRHPERFFQQICNGFDKPQQYAVTAFLKSMLEGAHLRKEIDRMMIRRAIQDAMPQTMLPPDTPPSSSSQQPSSVQRESARLSLPSRLASSVSSGGDMVDGSPLRLGRQPPKISPPTPKTIILDERTKQLKELKAQLEAERYEKGYLEVQLKQLQDKNEKFLEDKRKYVKEIRELRTELQACNLENESPNKQRGLDHKVARIERLLAEKEEALDRLKIELETVAENNRNSTEMINYRNVQIVKLKDQIQELENSLGSLSECIAEKDEVIKYLRENNEELQRFIDECRFKQNGPLPENLNTSFDGMMELSSGGSSNGTGKSYSITPENMAQAVVDVQLKEKEAENCLLKRSLEMIEQEKVRVSGMVGSFFRLYGDVVGALPYGSANPQDVGFVEKMNIFKACYESLFVELGKFKEAKEMLEAKSDALEEDVKMVKAELLARTEVLQKLERHSVDIEMQLELVRKTASEYQRKNAAMNEDLNRQKRDLLKLISEKDTLSQQNLTLNVEFNSLKGEHESLTTKIDYLMLSLNEDYEGSDFSSWFDKMDDLKERVRTLKEDKDRLTAMNMKIMMEKVALEKDVSVGEIRLTEMKEQQAESEKKLRRLNEQLQESENSLAEKDNAVSSLEKLKADLEENIQGLSAELLESQSKLNEMSEDFQSCEETLRNIRDELESRDHELLCAKNTIDELQTSAEKQQDELQHMTQLQEKTAAEREQLVIHLSKIQQDLNSESDKLEATTKELDEANDKNRQLTQVRDRLLEEKLALEEALSEQRNELNKSCKTVQNLELQIKNMQEMFANETEQSKEIQESLNAQIIDQRNQLDASHKEQNILSSANRSLLAGLELIQQKISQLESQYVTKINRLEAKLGEFAALLTKLSAYQFKLRLEKAQLEDNLGKMIQEFEALQTENEKLIESETVLQRTIQELQAEKTAAEERSIGLEDQLAEMEVRLDMSGSRIKELEGSCAELEADKTRLLGDGSQREAELRKQLEEAAVCSERLEQEIKHMSKSQSDLQLLLDAKLEQFKCVSDERDEMEVKCARLEVELKELQSDLEEQKQLTASNCEAKALLETQLLAVREELLQLEEERSRLEENCEENQAALEKHNKVISRLTREKELLEEKVQELTAVLATVRQTKSDLKQKLEEEQEKSDELSCQLEDLNSKILAVAEELGRVREEKEELQNRLGVVEVEKQELEERVQELTEAITLVEEDRDTLREEKCRLGAEVERVDHDKGSLDEQCGKLLKQLSKEREDAAQAKALLEETTCVLGKERDALQEKLKVIEKERSVLKGSVAELEETKKGLEAVLGEKGVVEGKVVELSKLIEELRSEKTELEVEKASLREEQQSNEKVIGELKENICALEETKTRLQEQVSAGDEASTKLQQELGDLSKALQVSKEEIETMEVETKKLSSELTQSNAEMESLSAELEQTHSQLQEVQEALKTKECEAAVVSEKLLESAKDLELVQQRKEEEILQKSRNIESIQVEHQDVMKRLQQALTDNSELGAKVENLTTELSGRSAELDAKKQEVEEKEQNIRSATELLIASQAKAAELSSTVDQLNVAKVSLETQLQKVQNDLDSERKLCSSKKLQVQELKASLGEINESKNCLEHELQQLEAERLNAESANQQLIQQLSDLKSQVAKQQTAIDAKDTEIHQLTEGLEKVKRIQSQLEEKVTDFESVVTEKDEIEAQLVGLQHELELVRDDKRKIETELETVKEEKADVDRRLIQQLQDYDTVNEAYLNERDCNKELVVKQQELTGKLQEVVEENARLVQGQESSKSMLAAKEKRLVEQEKQVEKLKREMENLFGKNQQMDSLTHDFMQLKVEKSELEAEKEELNEAIEQKEIEEKAMQESMNHLKESLKVKQQELDSLHSDVATLKETLHTMKIENSKLKSTHELQQTKMLNLELKNSEQSKKIEKLEESLNKTEISHLEDNSKASTLLKKLEMYKEYEMKMKELEELHQKEREINKTCMGDIDILRAKLIKHRQITEDKEQEWKQERLALEQKVRDAHKDAEVKMRETRIEYEAKLEKMKDKMKSLLNDELQKTRSKYEKEYLDLKQEIQEEQKKFTKMEMKAVKLEQQLADMKDLRKEYEFVSSRLRVMEQIQKERKSLMPPPPGDHLRSNLKMEDEEGELFNNTYLTDLKYGRGSPPLAGRESIRMSEIQQRNSMVPPHLKDSYMVQYVDGNLTDDDNRDLAAGNLDDSSTSLISRRKLGGTTSYKRPGPPTPSKKAGRRSFGGSLPTSDFQYKEILKDSSNGSSSASGPFGGRLSFGGRKSNVEPSSAPTAAGNSSGSIAELNARRKTPGKFKQMISSSNLFHSLQPQPKDEVTLLNISWHFDERRKRHYVVTTPVK
ncbi:putative leucine-rich repeat-containing protein DDB_G0290503 isoform X2 [Aedes albopictus]|uniref:Uncharacterized protein n=1 Tax=Aedes albopictus TaxID=7160 RepID=A0ABM1YHS8_AEDAL|nr:putative leucine-rich repeat-containing protein DDB_G0290503 isoform X2 [Aedes albopictus]